jgi:hypothetical protein
MESAVPVMVFVTLAMITGTQVLVILIHVRACKALGEHSAKKV